MKVIKLKDLYKIEFYVVVFVLGSGIFCFFNVTGGLPLPHFTEVSRSTYLGTLGDFLSPLVILVGAITLLIERFRQITIQQIENLYSNLTDTTNVVSTEIENIRNVTMELGLHFKNQTFTSDSQANTLRLLHVFRNAMRKIENSVFSYKGINTALKLRNHTDEALESYQELIYELCIDHTQTRLNLLHQMDKINNNTSLMTEITILGNEYRLTGDRILYLFSAISQGQPYTFDSFQSTYKDPIQIQLLAAVDRRHNNNRKREPIII